MAKVLEALIAKGRRAKRGQEQKEIAFGLADLSTHGKNLTAARNGHPVLDWRWGTQDKWSITVIDACSARLLIPTSH